MASIHKVTALSHAITDQTICPLPVSLRPLTLAFFMSHGCSVITVSVFLGSPPASEDRQRQSSFQNNMSVMLGENKKTTMASTVAERAIGAIIGAAVADAAAQPMHWIYNPERLKEVLSDLEPCPEFRPQSANPFYRRETGEQSCYGDQAYVLLESLSQCGDVNVEDLTKRIYKFFGPDTVYDLPLNNPYRQKNGPKAVLPIDGPWRHASLKAFMRNVDAGKEETGCDVDCQMDGVTKMAPVVAMFAGKPEMLEKVETAIRVTQNNDMCVAMTLAAARFLEHFILNGSDPNALDSVLAQLNDPNRNNPQDLDRAVIAHIYQVKDNLAKHSPELIPAVFTNT